MAKKNTAPKSKGSRSSKIKAYYDYRYAHNKLGRILRRSGEKDARRWAIGNERLCLIHI